MKELYISVDIESSGPLVGKHSMLSLGACMVGKSTESFYIELRPISMEAEPAAMKVSQFTLEDLSKTGIEPSLAMKSFAAWISEVAGDSKPVFVGFNASYDWQFVNWYFLTFGHDNPFGFSALDIKSYYMGKAGVEWTMTTSSRISPEYQPDTEQTHNALDDAIAQASIFEKLLAR